MCVGGIGHQHIGNRTFRLLVEANANLYAASAKYEKIRISKKIVETIRRQHPPGRFIVRDNEAVWTEIDINKAIRKTSQTFRDILGEQKRAANGDQPSEVASSTSVATTGSTTDSIISEFFAVPEVPVSSPTITIPEVVTSLAPANTVPEDVPRSVFTSGNDQELEQWLDDGKVASL